jgi:hypothetical protein
MVGNVGLNLQEVHMMRRRSVGRSVARAAVGTAVIAGTAGAVQHHQQQKYAAQDAANQPQQVVYEAPPPAAGSEIDDQLIQIQKLSSMKDQGLITEEEFQAKKKQILGI